MNKRKNVEPAVPAPAVPTDVLYCPAPAEFALSFRARAILLGVIAALTLLVVALVGLRWWEIGIPGDWQWQYYAQPTEWLFAMPPLFIAGVLVLAVVIVLRNDLRRIQHEAAAFLIVMGLSLAFILNLGGNGPKFEYEALDSIVATWSGGYYAEATTRAPELRPYLSRYNGYIRQLSVKDPVQGHIADHPAGPVVFHWTLNRALDAAPGLARAFTPRTIDSLADESRAMTWRQYAQNLARRSLTAGQIAGIWASAFIFRLGYWLALVPLYFLVRESCSREAGIVAVAFGALVPSLHLFGPYPDQLFPLFTMTALYAWHRALRRGSLAWGAVSGAVTVLGLLWSLSLLAAMAVLGFYTLFRVWHDWRAPGEPGLRRWWRAIPGWVAGFLICSLLPVVLFGYDTFGVWKTCLTQHATFADQFQRSYASWTLFNPVEFAVFTGLPIFGLLVVTAVVDARRWWRDRRTTPALLPWVLIGVLAALDLSGKNLGEVARLWMFLMPLAAASAAGALVGLDRHRGWTAGIILALTAAQAVVFRLSLNVFTI